MSLATLTVDFNARLANLETAVKRSADLTEKQATVMTKAYDGVTAAVRNVGGVLAGVFAVGTITAQFRAMVDGLTEIANAADATGASVESLSALDDIARRNGRSIGDVTELVQELNKALKETDDSNQAKALNAIGLSAQELRKLDPGEAVKVLADRLNELEDGGNKTRIALTILGESAGQYAPLLKEIAREGALVASVTKDQAEAARDYNRQVSTATTELSNFGRKLALDILPTLTRYTRELNAAADANLTLADRLKLGLTVPASAGENLNKLRAELDRLNQSRESFEARGMSTTAIDNNIESVQRRIEYFKRLQADAALANGASYSNEGRSGTGRQIAPDISAILATPKTVKVPKDTSEAMRRAAQEMADGWSPLTLRWELDKESQDAAEEGAQQVAKILAEMDMQRAGVTDEQQRALNQMNDMLAQQAQRYRDLADPTRKYMEQLEEIIRLGRTLDADGNPLLSPEEVEEATEAIKKQVEQVQAAKRDSRELGLVFKSAFEDAIVGGKGLRDVLQGLSQDIARLIVRRKVTEPLLEAFEKSDISIDSIFAGVKSFLGFADGGIMTSSGPVPLRKYSGGGIATSPQAAIFAEGGVPEAFVPVPSGKIPVELRGGGTTVVIHQNITFNGNADRATMAAWSAQLREQTKADVLRELLRGGAIARAVGK